MTKGIKGFQKGHPDLVPIEARQRAGKKISNTIKGHPSYLTKEAKKKISNSLSGKKRTEKTKLKISRSMRGSKSYLWKDGRTKLQLLIRNCFKYRQWRLDVFTRDDFTCTQCGARSGKGKAVYIEAHHLKRFAKILDEYKIKTLEEALNCKELWSICNGRTLCKKCHDLTKTNRH